MQNHWDERFATEEYVYGKEPNTFLKEFFEAHSDLFQNPVLMLGDGEGRNGVYLATQGLDVTSLDFSAKGLEKAKKLAQEKNVNINTVLADVNLFDFGKEKWGTIVIIYLHLPKAERLRLYEKIKEALLPNGLFFVEVFSQEQIKYNSGGPRDINLLYNKEELEEEFSKSNSKYRFEIIHSEEKIVILHEGRFHEGEGSVVRFVCKKNYEVLSGSYH